MQYSHFHHQRPKNEKVVGIPSLSGEFDGVRVIDQFLDAKGFEQSASELERCFRDPKTYGERLANLLQQTIVHDGSRTTLQFNSQPIVQQTIQQSRSERLAASTAILGRTMLVPEASPRKDHNLPRKQVGHLTKRESQLTQQIMMHLPERRNETRVHPPALQMGQALNQNVAPSLGHAHIIRSPRSLPRVPHRAPKVHRQVIYREYRSARNRTSTSSWIIGFILIILIGYYFDGISSWVRSNFMVLRKTGPMVTEPKRTSIPKKSSLPLATQEITPQTKQQTKQQTKAPTNSQTKTPIKTDEAPKKINDIARQKPFEESKQPLKPSVDLKPSNSEQVKASSSHQSLTLLHFGSMTSDTQATVS